MNTLDKLDITALAEDTIQKLKLQENLLIPFEQASSAVQSLTEFELGRSVMTLGHLNSSLVDYICHNEVSPTGHSFETWFLSKSPKIRAARERYHITKNILQQHLKSNITFGVMPCGVISKVAELDYTGVDNVKIVGYDNDIYGLANAEEKMQPFVDQGIVNLYLLKRNIWLLDEDNQYEVILSNRLSVLEHDSEKVLELFKKIYNALKPGGSFICSFFTPSPLQAQEESSWINVTREDMLLEHTIFVDIMDFHPAIRHKSEFEKLLKGAGFEVVNVIFDSQHVYPTVVAKKTADTMHTF